VSTTAPPRQLGSNALDRNALDRNAPDRNALDRNAIEHRVSRTLRTTTNVLPEHARRHNRSLVLQTLFHQGPLSRADLARGTGLTRVTVSDLVGDLLVEELGFRPESRIGKPATLVGMRADAVHILGIDVSEAVNAIGALLDMTGAVLHRRSRPLRGRIADRR
jgi:hypothetical protein